LAPSPYKAKSYSTDSDANEHEEEVAEDLALGLPGIETFTSTVAPNNNDFYGGQG